MRGGTRLRLAMLVVGVSLPRWVAAECACPGGGELQTETVYVPFTLVNADVGDALVHKGVASGNAGDIPGLVLGALGMTHTHAALVTADGPDGRSQEISEFDVNGAQLDFEAHFEKINRRVDPDFLAHLRPGKRSWSFDDYLRKRGFNLQTAKVLRAADRGAGEAAAATGRSLDGVYRIQAFSNLVYMNHVGGGSTCSGFVYWAWEKSGRGHVPPRHYSEGVRLAGGRKIYELVYGIVMARGVPVFSDEYIADRIANQVVNCFLDIDCGSTSDAWRVNPGTGLTVGPDDLMPGPGNSAFASVERMQTTGGRYVERGTCKLPGGGTVPAVCRDGPPGPPGDTGTPPTAIVLLPESSQGNIPVRYSLFDAESNPVTVTVEFTVDGQTWSLATMAPGGEPTSARSATPGGVMHTFVWNTLQDGVATMARESAVQIRVTPSDGKVGTPGVSDPFIVDNTAYFPVCQPSYDPGYCGDTRCGDCETPISCSNDCGTCGDSICGAGETADPGGTCAFDCGFCGDSVCIGGETLATCPVDCGRGCGDRTCRPEEGETPVTCPNDCGGCGNGQLDPGEDCTTCPDDAAKKPTFTLSPGQAVVDQLVTFQADASRLAEATPAWDFGDGVHERGNPIGHRYQRPGLYRVTLTATENRCFTTQSTYQAVLVNAFGPPCVPSCGDGTCCRNGEDGAEDEQSCPEDCVCGTPASTCGDGKCCVVDGENLTTCPGDCETYCDTCGNQACGACEDALSCPDDCTPVEVVCGDTVCTPWEEDCGLCPADCPCPAHTHCENRQCVSDPPVCGDLWCTPSEEDCGLCPGDCPCPAGTHCENRQCVPDLVPCGDEMCTPGMEDCGTCPADCPCPPHTHCENRQCVADPPVCGDLYCTPYDEGCGNCPGDCPCPDGTHCEYGQCVANPSCGNGSCEAGETCVDCEADCGACIP